MSPVAEKKLLHMIYNYFLWLLSLFCLILAIGYWIRIIGVFPGNLWRFDLMPQQWKILCGSMSVVYPIAACGLWMRSRWGIVLWILAGTAESLAMTVYASKYMWFPLIAVLHLSFLFIFILFQITLFFMGRRKKRVTAAY